MSSLFRCGINAAIAVLHQHSDEHEGVDDDNELRSWLVVLVHDGGTTWCRAHGMDRWAVSGDGVMRCSNCPCDLAHTRRQFVSRAGTGRVLGAAAGRTVGATSVDSLGTACRNECQGRRWVLFSGATVVFGLLESSGTVIAESRLAHVLFPSDCHATLRWSVSAVVA